MKFEELGLHVSILEALEYMGFKEATPIQEQAIPKILEGKDLIACAQTGTGKTAAFTLPILDKVSAMDKGRINTLVLAPTRELAMQIDQQIQGFSYFSGVESIPIYGGGDGHEWQHQKNAIKKGTDIIVATPGKLISHLKMGYVDFSGVKFLILDEADRMLDIGFHDDIMNIISYIPKERQSLLFSATMPNKIRDFAKKILNNPDEISLGISKPAAGVLQAAYLAFDSQKNNLVGALIKGKKTYKSIIIFCSTKKGVSELTRSLKRQGYSVEAVSSSLEQKEREAAVSRFRAKQTRIIVATDVLSRGIDIKDINLVINYDVPGDAEDYVHRIGRTARADTTGVALTFINEADMYKFQRIEQLIESEVRKLDLPEGFDAGPKWDPEKSRKMGNRGRGRQSSGNKGKGSFKKKRFNKPKK